MKTIFISIFLLAGSVFSYSQSYPDGKTILDKVDENLSSKTRVITSKMEITTTRGTRTMVTKSWAEGDTRAYTEYLAPAREKGTKMLKLDKQLWIYSPSTDRVIQLSGHMLRQSVMGSDLSYEDMLNDTPLLEQYIASVEGEEVIDDRKCWVVSLTAVKPDVTYFSQKLWVDQERYVPLRIDLYAKSGKMLKQITMSDLKRVQQRWFPMTMLYRDMLKGGSGTKVSVEEIHLDVKIPESYFNRAMLK